MSRIRRRRATTPPREHGAPSGRAATADTRLGRPGTTTAAPPIGGGGALARRATRLREHPGGAAAPTRPPAGRGPTPTVARPRGRRPCSDRRRWQRRSPRRRRRSGSDGALRVADLGDVRAGLAIVGVVLGRFLGRGEAVELLEPGRHAGCASGALHPRPEALAGLSLAGEATDHTGGRLGGVLGRQAKGLVTEVDLLLPD